MNGSAVIAARSSSRIAYAPTLYAVPLLQSVPPTPFVTLRSIAWSGIALIAVFVFGTGLWSVAAPLESAAIAPGLIEVETSRKTVQHLEGGIIAAILVKDGDEVVVDQPLIRLDDVKARTQLVALKGQLWDGWAREARLMAERDKRDEILYPNYLTQHAADPAVRKVLAGQTKIFKARRSAYDSKVALITQRIAQTREEIVGLHAQEAASRKRIALLSDELDGLRQLLKKGFVAKPRYLQVERDLVETNGRRGELVAQIARAQQTIVESEISIVSLEHDTQSEIAQSLRDAQNQIHDLIEQVQAATHVLARTEIRALQAGTVTDLRVRTPGGVVAPGEPLLDIVPKEDRLIVTAQVLPEDIDLVRPGLPAQVRLIPYRQRRTPRLDGAVIHVSADRLVDQKTNQPYYLAKIEVGEDVLRRLEGIEMVPGMPVEVMIKTGETSVALYALAPILDSFNRAFREN